MQDYYSNNKTYASYLEGQDPQSFSKYIRNIINLLSNRVDASFLDIGCGTGIALEEIKKKSKSTLHGTDINSAGIEVCKQKGLNCILYDGNSLPFSNELFSVVGTFNVLEHTENPILFLDEIYRVTEINGFLIIGCPNLLSITNNYHPNTAGITQKIRNLSMTLKKLSNNQPSFNRLEPYTNKLIPDHDACVETNPIDILKWAKNKNLQVMLWSSAQYDNVHFLKKLLDFYPFKLTLGSCFFIFRKTQ